MNHPLSNEPRRVEETEALAAFATQVVLARLNQIQRILQEVEAGKAPPVVALSAIAELCKAE